MHDCQARLSASPVRAGFDDISYNYLIGADGVVYEGRGRNKKSAAAMGWNQNIVSLAFIGLFNNEAPSVDALFAAEIFLQYLVDEGRAIILIATGSIFKTHRVL